MPRLTYTKKLMVYGYVNDGDTVHYVDKNTRKPLLAGRIVERGILVEGQAEPVTLAKFEAMAGRYYVKAPTRYIILPSGKSMEDALNEIRGLQSSDNGSVGGSGAGRRGRKSKQEEEAQEEEAYAPETILLHLLKDENDPYCVYCGYGSEVVELLRCASCPTAMHAACPSVEDILRAHQAMEVEATGTAEGAGGGVGMEGVKTEGADAPRSSAQTVGQLGNGHDVSKRDSWRCPACLCCICSQSIDMMGAQYRGAVYVRGDSETGPYVDILDPSLYKRLHIGRSTAETQPSAGVSGVANKASQGSDLRDRSKSCEVEEKVTGDVAGGERNGRGEPGEGMLDAGLQLPTPPTPPTATHVVVSSSGARSHASCVDRFQERLTNGEPFDRDNDRALFTGLAKLCLRGAMNIGYYAGNKRVWFQIIHAAAATGRDVHGVAPIYTEKQKLSLRKIISAGWSVIKDSYEEIWDSRTGVNLAPMMLQGASHLPFLDYSGMFIATLFIDSAIVSVACFRVLGPVAELPIVATRRDLRGIQAASTLLARLDHELHRLGVEALVTQATYKEAPGRYFPYTPSLNPPGAPLPPPGQEAFGFKIARKAYVDAVISRGGFNVPGISWAERETGQFADWSVWSSKLTGVKVELSKAVDIKSRVTLMMIKRVPRSKAQQVGMHREIKTEPTTEADRDTEPSSVPATNAKTENTVAESSMPGTQNGGFEMKVKEDTEMNELTKGEGENVVETLADNEDEIIDITGHRGTGSNTRDVGDAQIGDAQLGEPVPLDVSSMQIDSEADKKLETSDMVVKSLVDSIVSSILAPKES